ncbi:BTB/POZ domain-containing protein [Cryptosporidium felis]|nr:BTB/POZ domain-containing protein [Cryptosporidium felis]
MPAINYSSSHINKELIEYIWIIEDFPILRTLAIQHALPNYDRVMSQKFGDQQNGLWFLALFPAGINCDGKMLSIYLFSSSDKTRVAEFEISLLDEEFNIIEGSTVSLSQPKVFSISDPSWGWEDYMRINRIDEIKNSTPLSINSNSNQTIPNPFETTTEEIRTLDELLFNGHEGSEGLNYQSDSNLELNGSEINLLEWDKTILKYFVIEGMIRVKVTIRSYLDFVHLDGNVMVSDSSLCRSTTKDFVWLANDISKFSIRCSALLHETVTISCDDELFHVPRFTLAARSKYFEKIFISNFSESNNLSFSIPVEDASPWILKNAIDYILTGNCELLKRENLVEVMELFKFSDKYGILSLCNACIPIIIANIDKKSIWKIMIIAQQCNSEIILDAVKNFIKREDISQIATTLVNYILELKKQTDNY